MKVKYFLPEIKASFNLSLSNLLSQVTAEQDLVPIRLVLFSNATEECEKAASCSEAEDIIIDHFGDKLPTWNMIAQAPLCSDKVAPLEGYASFPIAVEATYLEEGDGEISFRTFENRPYIIAESEGIKNLYMSGIKNPDTDDIHEQCKEIFAKLERLLELEKMPINSISRQWNYIPHIVATVEHKQNYQEFNDARTYFYDKTQWTTGYPAATGIGTACGKISVDVDAVVGKELIAVDNKLQIAAHVYSQEVLIGSEKKHKHSPKFERAKLAGERLYISGTASILGEESVGIDDIDKQTEVTLANIDHLREQGGVATKMSSMRAYLKRPEFSVPSRKITEAHDPDAEVLYVIADVCREELLIEIEGLTYK